MATEQPSLFTKYQFDTPEELISAYSFSLASRQLIQNLICEAAEEKVKLTYDPAEPMKFVQREAELQGQIGILTMLLTGYNDNVELLKSQQSLDEQ